MDMEILYGIDLDGYLRKQGFHLEDLIRKVETDIEMLRANYIRYADRNYELADEEQAIALKIYEYMKAKEKKLEYLKQKKIEKDKRVERIIRGGYDESNN